MDDTLTPAVEAAFDRLDASMEASFDRIDALLAQILNRFQERIISSERKISLDLQDRYPVVVPPQTHSDYEICNGFQQRRREATSLDRKHVLKSCDFVYGFHVSDGVSVPTVTSMAIDAKLCFDVKKAPLCTAVLAYDDLLLQTHVGDEIGDGFKRRRVPTSPNSPLLHSEVANHEGSNCTSAFLVSADAFTPSAITEPPLMTLPILESECTRGLVAPLSPSVSIMVGSEALQNLDQEAWKKLGLGVYPSCVMLASKAPHALHLYVEMHHSGGLCYDGNGILDFDVGCHMGIRDKGGGFAVYTGRTGSDPDLQLFDEMLVGYHMRISDKGGGLMLRPSVGLLSLLVCSLLQTLIDEMEVKGLTTSWTSFADFAPQILQVDDKLSNQVLVGHVGAHLYSE